jgi:DNA repair protein SbcC/Rad50
MLERLQIVNFQRHERLRIKLDQQITTIVGPSDTGKSAVLRAVRWLAFNRPRGTGFVRHGEDECSVKLWVDGRKVERRRTKTENLYLLDDRQLKAVGTDVPEEVARLLNLSEENFQGQHDAPFWISLTPGEVARRLNAIVDLEVIDRSSSWLASRLRRAAAERDVVEKRKTEAEEEKAGLSWVPMMTAEYRRVEKAEEVAGASRALASRLSRCVEEAGIQAEKAEEARRTAETARNAADAGKTARRSRKGAVALADLLEALREAEEKAGRRLPDAGPLKDAHNRVERLVEQRKSLRNILRSMNQHEARANESAAESKAAEEELQTKAEGRCPLCGGTIDERSGSSLF